MSRLVKAICHKLTSITLMSYSWALRKLLVRKHQGATTSTLELVWIVIRRCEGFEVNARFVRRTPFGGGLRRIGRGYRILYQGGSVPSARDMGWGVGLDSRLSWGNAVRNLDQGCRNNWLKREVRGSPQLRPRESEILASSESSGIAPQTHF